MLLARLETGSARAADHPQFLLSSNDLPRLQHLCGVAQSPNQPTWGRFGAFAGEFTQLRRRTLTPPGESVLPGEMIAAAFVHRVDPADPANPRRLALVDLGVQRAADPSIDPLERAVAAEWCWPALNPAAREAYLEHIRESATGLAAGDSPLEPRGFREKLAWLVMAIFLDDDDVPGAAWESQRLRLRDAARTYFATSFPNVVSWRGFSPTGPGMAADEELLTALAIELSGALDPAQGWQRHAPPLARWLEHYLYAAAVDPARPRQFDRDDGDLLPGTPAAYWNQLHPLTAHLIAARTQAPAAIDVARLVELTAVQDAAGELWRWVFFGFPLPQGRTPPRAAELPLARNFGGAVCFLQPPSPRGSSDRKAVAGKAIAIWIEAGQPFLRRRQHFDAGHFLIRAAGYLTTRGGDNVALEAIASRGGSQRHGRDEKPFSFEQYYTATIAHNALVAYDTSRLQSWNGEPYRAVGGQRPIEETCTDWQTPLETQKRIVARPRAYGQRESLAYLALDLAPAYDPRSLRAYTREFIWVVPPQPAADKELPAARGERRNPAALVVVDRVQMVTPRVTPVWVLNVPTRPLADEQVLRPAERIFGPDNDAGVWRTPAVDAYSWRGGTSAARLVPLLPAPRRARITGGPARLEEVATGSHAGRKYVGGSAESFERLILPAERRDAHNVWYRLGRPGTLGADFGATPHWGRIELEPASARDRALFLNVLLLEGSGPGPEPARAELIPGPNEDPTTRLAIEFSGHPEIQVELPPECCGGIVTLAERAPISLPTAVEPDAPIE